MTLVMWTEMMGSRGRNYDCILRLLCIYKTLVCGFEMAFGLDWSPLNRTVVNSTNNNNIGNSPVVPFPRPRVIFKLSIFRAYFMAH